MTDLPALLDELERERIENAHLREAFVTMEQAYNAAALDLAAARAVLETANPSAGVDCIRLWVDRAAWLAWQETKR